MTVNTKKAVPKELIDSLLADYKKPEDLIGENGLLKHISKLMTRQHSCELVFQTILKNRGKWDLVSNSGVLVVELGTRGACSLVVLAP